MTNLTLFGENETIRIKGLSILNGTIELPKPHYETLPNYNTMLIINVICVSLMIKKFPAWLDKQFQPKSHFGKLLCSDRFLLEIMSWGNIFLLIWNIFIPIFY